MSLKRLFDYPLNTFKQFSKEKQFRLLHKNLLHSVEDLDESEKTYLLDYLEISLKDEDFEIESLGPIGQLDVQKLLAFLEKQLKKSVRDEEIVVRRGDDHSRRSLKEKLPVSVALYNLRSAFNVGSIFRTCECFALQSIYLIGYTPTPEQPQVKKTAMGMDEVVNWQSLSWQDCLEQKGQQYWVGLETVDKAKEICDFDFPQVLEEEVKSEIVLFFGNERWGMPAEVLKTMDVILQIGLSGAKNSLNVASSFAISAYEVRRQWTQK